MWLILGVLAFACAVILERLYFYFVVCRDDADTLVDAATRALNQGEPDTALQAVSARQAPLNAILASAIGRYREGYSFVEVRRAVEEVALREVPRFTRRLSYLATFANVATLVGLLGTIYGLQTSFSSLAMVGAAEKASMLASGISQAMNTTAFGLMVAIPCMIAHAKLSSMQAKLTEDLDAGTLRFMNHLESRMECTADSANGCPLSDLVR